MRDSWASRLWDLHKQRSPVKIVEMDLVMSVTYQQKQENTQFMSYVMMKISKLPFMAEI